MSATVHTTKDEIETKDSCDTSAIGSVKRTRRGEKFTLPTEVNLHANDFEWEDLLVELPDEDRKTFEEFRRKCHEQLVALEETLKKEDEDTDVGRECFIKKDCVPTSVLRVYAPPPLHDSSKEEKREVATVHPTGTPSSQQGTDCSSMHHIPSPQAWEKHYSTNRQHFPVKNYIIHAFPSLLPLLGPNETHAKALQRLTAASLLSADGDDDGAAAPSDHPLVLSSSARTIMEAGCGTGSVVLPLMRLFPCDTFVCHDVSPTAVETLRSHAVAAKHTERGGGLFTFVCDLSATGHSVETAMHTACPGIGSNSMDFVLLVFVLSALPSLPHMVHLLRQLRSYLKPSGKLLFRDYGALDHNFFRFHRQQNVFLEASLTFLKGDGTEQFFFDTATTVELFRLAGLEPVSATSISYHCNRIINRKNGKRMDKVFINGEFKPVVV